METNLHRVQMALLIETADRHLRGAGVTDYFVGGNMFLYFSALQAKKNDFRGPDVFVVLGTEHRDRKSWVVWEEGGRGPDVIIELTSEATAQIDRGEKKRIYGSVLGVPEYFIFDPLTGDLEGYRLVAGKRDYEPIAPSPDGRLRCERLGLELGRREGEHLGFVSGWLRWFSPGGAAVPTAAEMAAEAERRAEELAGRLRTYEERFGPLK